MSLNPNLMTDHARDWAAAQAMLLGFECREVTSVMHDTPGVRWNSGTALGQWAPNREAAVVSFLSAKGYFVTVDGELVRI